MTYDEHLELRNDLYQTSLRLFRSDIKWLSEYIPSVSKWRLKVMLREELENFTGENCQNNKSSEFGKRIFGQSNLTISSQPEENLVSISNSEGSPDANLKNNLCDINDAINKKEEISIKIHSIPSNFESRNNSFYSNGVCATDSEKTNSGINNFDNACKINVDKNDELPVYDKLHVDNKNNEIKMEQEESVCTHEEQNEKNGLSLSINFENSEKNEVNEFNQVKAINRNKSEKDEFRTYNILTGKDGKHFKENDSNISSFGLTLWEYLPLVAILSGCTGIFIIFRLSSAMYRYSVLSCIISHLVTFLLIGIPLSQLEFSMRKKGQRYGFLEAMQYFNPKYVGITILSLVTVMVIFLYSVQIIGSLSVILYNISKKTWRITLDDALVCSQINNSIFPTNGELIDTIKSGKLTPEILSNAYSLCSLSSVCNMIIPFFQDKNSMMNAIKSYITTSETGNTTKNTRVLDKSDIEFFEKADKTTNNSTDSQYSPNFPKWCLPSPSKKLRNLMILQQSGYQETIYFSLKNAIINIENLSKHQIFPIKKPLKWFNSNLLARIIGISCALIFVILSINGGGKLYRLASFLSFLSLMTLFLTASIQIVANDIQLNIFISILVTQEGIKNLLSPAIWYCSINNTLLFFGISFLITMFPLKELITEDYNHNTSNSLSYEKDHFYDKFTYNHANSRLEVSKNSISSIFDTENQQSDKVPIGFKKPRICEITLRKHVSKIYKSVYNQEIEKSNLKHRDIEDFAIDNVSKVPNSNNNEESTINQNKHAKHNMALDSYPNGHEEQKNFPSLMSAANSAVFFLACVMISSMVVLISNAALISLSESPNTPLLLPFNEKSGNAFIISSFKKPIGYQGIYKSNTEAVSNTSNGAYHSDGSMYKGFEYFDTSKLFHENNWLMHNVVDKDSGNFQETFQIFNGESGSMEEISFLKNHMANWFKWNFHQVKSQSLILGEFMIIYLIIIAIEVSKRIPSGVIIFFIFVVFSFAISSACLCTSIISKHIFVIFNYWILPIIAPKFGISDKDSELNNSKNRDKKTIRRLRKHTRDTNLVKDLNYFDNYKEIDKNEKERKLKTGKKKEILLNIKKSKIPLAYKIKSFFKLVFCILSSFLLLIKLQIFKFIGISYKNKQNRKFEKMTFFVQFSFIALLIIMALLINIASQFIPRFPLDYVNENNKILQEQLELSKSLFFSFSEKNELLKHYNNDIYVAKAFNIAFGSLFDIRIISGSVNFMLALTAGFEVIILTWYMYRDIQEEIIGRNALKFQTIGFVISTVLLSIGFLLGAKSTFVIFILLSISNYLVFFAISRYFAKKNFKINHEQVIKRQKYSPIWWLCISNIDILRRKLNSQELEDAGSLTYYSEKSIIQVGNANSDNYDYCFNDLNNKYISKHEYFSKNEELIESISNFNLYCNVRSRQPLFISFWFIMAKYFSPLLIFSTIPLSIANSISLLFFRLDCLDGIVSEILLLNYISEMRISSMNITNRVSIFQPIQVIVISILIVFGISTALIITLYIKFKQDKLRKISNNDNNHNCLISNNQNNSRENQEISLSNILDDVYESLKVPKCVELYSNKRIESLGKMPQKLIISLAMLENHKFLNKYK
ncbi:hypothetical protein CmeUKMEL1_15295 [Cryptosporidium meleagridis]|uniref:Uncharacterized protein n=1 Tax=Cryptosporidium meleagridis TaxID=93969 RepID=A0A2P4Z4L2_9CRYT|nr:hypothetical protein CmeUKMEL1_15295 [Cryptosporidium meleagridis]